MDRSQHLAKFCKNAWFLYKENHQVDNNLWYEFLISFLPNHRFMRINHSKEEGLIPICKDNNLIIFITSPKFTLYDCDRYFVNFSHEIEDRNVLMLNLSSEGIELFIYYSKRHQTFGKFKVLKFKEGIVPHYFLELIKKNSSNLSPIEFLIMLCDTSALENEFLKNLMSNYANSKGYTKAFLLTYIVILLLCSNFIQKEYFHIFLRRERSKSRFITLKSFIILFQNVLKHQNESLNYVNDISIIISQMETGSHLIDLGLTLKLIKQFPFSYREPSLLNQEVAINPLVLSSFEETSFVSENTKKQGKYYTNIQDANFISQIALFRFLKGQNLSVQTNQLFNWIYSYHDLKPNQTITSNTNFKFNNYNMDILDPSCGSGTFLVSMAQLFFHLKNKNLLNDDMKLQLWGFEPNKEALLVARIRLIFLIMEEMKTDSSISQEKTIYPTIRLIFDNLKNEDFLFYPFSQNFDLIIGNPPFVRQEDIGAGKDLKYKEQLIQRIKKISRINSKFDKKSDLYIYFCLLGLSLLRDGGVLAYLTSNSWLEVKYGQTLQNFLLDEINQIKRFEIIQKNKKRLWQNIGINSIILICEKSAEEKDSFKDVLFVNSDVDFVFIPKRSLFKGLITCNNHDDDYYRVEAIERKELAQTHKWAGNFLRTKNLERILIRKLSDTGVPLHSLADIKFGIKTGSNDFFHLEIIDNNDVRDDPNLFLVRNKLNYEGLIERKYLRPLIKSPTHVKGFIIPNDFKPKYWLFYCTDNPEQLMGSMTWRYIQWGEQVPITIKQGLKDGTTVQGIFSLKSIANREKWYSLPEYPRPTMLWAKSYHNKPGCFLNDAGFMPDQRFYGIKVKDNQDIPLIFTYLNSSLVWAQMESQGNTNMGYGVLDTNVYWLKNLKIPIDALAKKNQINRLMEKLTKENERVSIDVFSKIRNEIDRFYAPYFNLDEKSLETLKAYNYRSFKNRLS
ncbi:MAG: Eco57I restriction-modification methylase domain-containing protein [Candidatus Hodarchaeota archaeon]